MSDLNDADRCLPPGDFFIRHARDIILLLDEAGTILDANEAAVLAYGRGRDDLLGANIVVLGNWTTLAGLAGRGADAAEEGAALFEAIHCRADGSPFPVEVSAVAIDYQGRHYRQYTVRDISERKRIEREIRDQEQLLQTVIDCARDTILMVRVDGTVRAINEIGAARFGTRPERLIGVDLAALMPAELAAARRAAIRQAVEGQRPVRVVDERDGRTYDYTIYPVSTDEDCAVAFATDITEQRLAEAAARRTERRLELALEAANEAIWEWSVDSGDAYVSPNFYTMLGYAENEFAMSRASWGELLHPEDQARVIASLERQIGAGTGMYEDEYRLRRKSGDWLWVLSRGKVIARTDDGRPLLLAGTNRDITVRKQREQALLDTLAQQRELNRKLEETQVQLLQSEKMASIGQLAAGVAHELNNPIGFVHSNLGTLDGYLRDLFAIADAYEEAGRSAPEFAAVRALRQEKDYDYLKQDVFQLMLESKEGLGRVRKIVQDLKDFSRVGDTDWRWANLHQGLDSTLNIVWNELKYKCKVTKAYGELPEVFCLPSQLNQVFMNLLVNAGQAIVDKGEITIRSGCTDDQVWVSIADTGKGIAAQDLGRIFEPFFTTKPVGKGTGLGLSLSYSIVKRHQGRIDVQSEPGSGSTFTVHLPVRPEIDVSIQKAVQTP